MFVSVDSSGVNSMQIYGYANMRICKQKNNKKNKTVTMMRTRVVVVTVAVMVASSGERNKITWGEIMQWYTRALAFDAMIQVSRGENERKKKERKKEWVIDR